MLCVTGLNALGPSVTDVSVPDTSAVSEPRTAAAATAEFAGFRDNTACGAYWTNGHCRDCLCGNVGEGKTYKIENSKKVIA